MAQFAPKNACSRFDRVASIVACHALERTGGTTMKHAYVPRTTNYSLNPGDELNDLRMSDQVRPLYEHVKKFIRETVEPMSVEFARHGENKQDRWSFTDDQLAVLQKA